MKSSYLYIKCSDIEKVSNLKHFDIEKMSNLRDTIQIEIRNIISELLIEYNSDFELYYCEIMFTTLNKVDYMVVRLMPDYVIKTFSKRDIIKLKRNIMRIFKDMKIVKETTQSSNLSVTAANHVNVPDMDKVKKLKLIKNNIRKVNGDTK